MASDADPPVPPEESDLRTLIGELFQNAERLIQLQLDLLRAEVGQEIQKAGGAAAALGTGAGLVAVGGVLSTQMLVHLLHRSTRLPLWACYGLLAGTCGAAGVGLLARARTQAASLSLPALPATAEGLKENLTWLKDQATAGRP